MADNDGMQKVLMMFGGVEYVEEKGKEGHILLNEL